ncbi:SDR family NAD(P)-dependent oxidoreductase [Streptococcus equi]|uniref:SDR family NAD(P)-dependent oxidoreductase n=1 Tax=Streptococcus equi TaxID=1336 RepID=UPI001E4D8BB8|nr:SDR family NAD(P)-dependent oxidoreductase [Streptococcus equi]
MVSQAVGRILVAKKAGVIINMASEAGLEAQKGKAPMRQLSGCLQLYTLLAKELGKHGVRVVGIAPGIMEATGLRTLLMKRL